MENDVYELRRRVKRLQEKYRNVRRTNKHLNKMLQQQRSERDLAIDTVYSIWILMANFGFFKGYRVRRLLQDFYDNSKFGRKAKTKTEH